MISRPSIRKRRIAKLLSREGGGTEWTNRLGEIPEVARKEISEYVDLSEEEEILLVSYRSEGEWCALTTLRLIWVTGGQVDSRPWEEVHGVQMPVDLVKAVIVEELEKYSVKELEIFDEKEVRHILHPEPGRGYFMVLSAINALCSQKREPEWPSFRLPKQEGTREKT